MAYLTSIRLVHQNELVLRNYIGINSEGIKLINQKAPEVYGGRLSLRGLDALVAQG